MKTKKVIGIAIAALFFILISCNKDSPMPGGPCEYNSVPGHATITSITKADSSEGNCPNNPHDVKFSFTPSESTAVHRYIIPSWPDTGQRLMLFDGLNPSLSWIARNGIAVGNVYSCFRLEITQGTCVPVIFTIQGIDLQDTAHDCYGIPASIPFKPSTGNYFLDSTYAITHTPTFFVIRSYDSFDSLFKWAATVNQDTSQIIHPNEMQSDFVIDVLIQGTFSLDIVVNRISMSSGILIVYYAKSVPVPHPSWTANNHAIVLVSNCNFSYIRFCENGQLLNNAFVESH